MLFALVVAQLGVAQHKPVDSTYATDALRTLVQAAAAANRAPPSALSGYRAHLETEIGFLVVDTLGRETTGQIEQLGSTVTWSRDSGYDAHVVGYRTQSAGGFPMSIVGVLKAWTVPMLYGDRLPVGIELGIDSTTLAGRESNRLRATQTVSSLAVHPFASDREQYYSYTGGDTVAVLTTPRRRITLVRIRVIPHLAADSPLAAFDGEVDIDVDRLAIVRMRGQFLVNKPPKQTLFERAVIAATATVAVAYVEYVNAEYAGQYWLPATQRFEAQARIGLMGGVRPVLRIVSHFSDVAIDDTTLALGDTTADCCRRGVTFAPSDSMTAYAGWLTNLGTATSSVAADDFDDIAPPAWKGAGPPALTFYPSRPDRVAHYDRIEGLFTGVELSLEMRGAAPGVVGRLHGGWAWAENTARGGLTVLNAGKMSRTELQLDRSLATTGNFQNTLNDGASSFGAFLASIEDEDYVDRWNASVANTRVFGSLSHAFATLRLGAARDVDVEESITHGPIRRSVLFLPNRHSATGSYGLAALDYEFHPNVTGEFLDPGIGSTLHVEGATGQLSWVRTVATLSARDFIGPVVLTGRLRGGAVFSSAPPPQTLFELGGGLGGGGGGLNGFTYKEFAGDRAATFRGFALYGFPVLRAPHRWRWFLIPGLSPGLIGGLEGDWTQISDSAAQQAVYDRGDGTAANALSRATGGVRSTMSFGLTFFAHSLSVGVARPVGQPGRWRWVFGIG